MFFTGTLQEGISTALQQSKLVACFVADDQEESKTWETEYLTDMRIASSLEKEAVVLRLTAGSAEAGYLAAIFPLPKIPALVIIKNGALKEYVAAGTEKNEFVSRVAGAFTSGGKIGGAHAQGQEEAVATTAEPVVQADTATSVAAAQPTRSTDATTDSSGVAAVSATDPSAEHISNEGERRRQAARKERERIEREKAQRRKEKGKMPASGGSGSGNGNEEPSKPKQNESVKKASQQLAEKQRQAREERARVLKLIADDKAERKAKEEMRKAEREAERSGAGVGAGTSAAATAATTAPTSSVQRKHDQCAIQVRLFDGSTIRTRFPSKATIAQDVRSWVDENRTDGKDPYTFKAILTPLPNRAIDQATEENKTLQDLELAPSSTLVLTPVDRYTTAYTNMNAGLSNPVSRFITAVLAFVVNVLGGIAGAIGGGGGAVRGGDGSGEDAGHELSSSPSSSAAAAQAQTTGRDGGGRVRGFQNPDDRRKDYQLYNGNSLNFEPRKDEEEKDQ